MECSNQSLQSSEEVSKKPISFLEKIFSQLIDKHPLLTLQQSFHLEYCKLYVQNIHLNWQVNKTKQQIHQMQIICPPMIRFKQINHESSQSGLDVVKKKRMRRTANEIARHYTCSVDKCQKSYGSEGSLNQHIKLSHRHIYTHYQ